MQSAFHEKQVDEYLDHINVPARFRRTNAPRPDLELLRVLHTHQLCAVPFENLSIHYSPDHEVILDPQFLYRKIVSSNGRGGYCMENGIFFNHVLRALGFNAYLAGGRVRPRVDGVPVGPYMGWVHCVNIVTFEDGSRYMTDVGYGGDGPIAPLPMIHDKVLPNIGEQEVRLVHESIPGQADPSQKQWIYQFRNDSSKEFNSCYSFLDREFIQEDFEVMSFFTSKHSRSYMVSTIIVVRFLHRDYHIYGKRMLINHEVKENTGGKTQTLNGVITEKQRIEILNDSFGITLNEKEQRSIYDTKLALA